MNLTATIAVRWIFAFLLLAAEPAFGQVTPMDLQVVGRALGFLDKPLSGDVHVALVYTPSNPQSVQAAESLRAQMGDGLKIGATTLKPLLVPMTEISHANAELFFLTPGTGAEASALTQVTQAKHRPCITTDIAQVRAGRCAVGISSQPRIEIVVNRAAAAASGMAFSTVFRMMITEL
jgi:hypothetical protein